jgi:hypothetical protein
MNIQEIINNISSASTSTSTSTSNKDFEAELLLNETKSYLENKTMASILKEKEEVLMSLSIDNEMNNVLMKKLHEYRFVDEIYELHRGKHVRWIRKSDISQGLKLGGIVVDIKFLDNGTQILVRNRYSGNKMMQYKFDDVLTFQKLSCDEQIILSLIG